MLNAQKGRSLLLSKYGLDAKVYNTVKESVTWETCTLRSWLNNDFLKTAFTAAEQSSILITTVDNGIVQGAEYDTVGGNSTQDQVFLLSYYEAFHRYSYHKRKGDSEYLATEECAATDYAVWQGAVATRSILIDDRAAGWWWLRSPSSHQSFAMYVSYDGISSGRTDVDKLYCVRPALWINLESDIF